MSARVEEDLPYEVVIVQRDGSTDLRGLFYAQSDAVAFAEIRPGYYGAKWMARRRSDGREVVATKFSGISTLFKEVFAEKEMRIMDVIRPHIADASVRREIRQAVKEILHSEGKRKINWMGLGHGTRILDILERDK